MTAWSVELSEFGFNYKGRGPMKASFLTNFLVKFSQLGERNERWTIIVDGSSNKKGNGVGVILEGLDGITLKQVV